MQLPVRVPLSSPITHGDKTITEIVFPREAEAGDLAASDHVKGDMTRTLAILSSMSDVPLPVLKRLKARDFKRVSEAVAPLLGNEDTPLDSGPT